MLGTKGKRKDSKCAQRPSAKQALMAGVMFSLVVLVVRLFSGHGIYDNAQDQDLQLRVERKMYPEIKKISRRDRKHILVTGGAGFVGSNLVDRLLREGHYVIVVDNFFTGRRDNLRQWDGFEQLEIIRHDVTEPINVEVDQIYHLACPASPPHYMYNKIKTVKTSTQGTLNMLGLAKRVKARILLTSTSEVYGDPLVHPQKEDYWGNVNMLGPRSCYDEGKRLAETLMMSYHEQSNVETRIARIFNTFGPNMHPSDGRVVSNFIVQALQGKDLTIYGDGKQTRSFQYVDDLVDGLMKLMASDEVLPVNIGNPREMTINEFAKIIQSKIGSNTPNQRPIEIVHLKATRDDPRQRKPDISKAKRVLGWEPKIETEDGIDLTIKYFESEIERLGSIDIVGPLARRLKEFKRNVEVDESGEVAHESLD